jgi:predicted TIM-barrel fold metal-dependent hydrolase
MSQATIVDRPIISADSHIVEPPNCYTDYIDPKFRDEAPHVVRDDELGDLFVVPGMPKPITLSLTAAAGIPPEELRETGRTFDELHLSGHRPEARAADQDRDGVAAEIIYPTVGMLLCNHKDHEFKQACFEAYNRWISDYCSYDPARLLGLGQTAALSVERAIVDLETMKELGLRGVMMPGYPGDAYNGNTPDYDDPYWDPFYQASIQLEMPIGFHILTMGGQRHRGPKAASFMSLIRGNQDIVAMMVLGGVFERNPELVIACTEADAGWAPHFMYRMDHAVKRHHNWMTSAKLSRLPSEYCLDHVRLTFQDDWVAFQMCRLNDMPLHKMLMWANDFPHSDSTWPWSQEMLAEHTKNLTDEEKRAVLHDNVASLYNLA